MCGFPGGSVVCSVVCFCRSSISEPHEETPGRLSRPMYTNALARQGRGASARAARGLARTTPATAAAQAAASPSVLRRRLERPRLGLTAGAGRFFQGERAASRHLVWGARGWAHFARSRFQMWPWGQPLVMPVHDKAGSAACTMRSRLGGAESTPGEEPGAQHHEQRQNR